jgi:hypothetical protein
VRPAPLVLWYTCSAAALSKAAPSRPKNMTDGHLAEKKIFSYEQAVALLPEVRRLTEEAHHHVEALATEGSAPEVRTRIEEIVLAWARTLGQEGLEAKGIWLVDFDNGSGYYCWRYPEGSLQFYHSYEDGFQGRMRIQ